MLETDTRTKSVPEAMTGTRSVTDTWTELLLVAERGLVLKIVGGSESTPNTETDTGTRSVLKIDTRTRRQVPETEWDSWISEQNHCL